MSEMTKADVEEYLHRQIPITKAMQVKVESCDRSGLVLTAPLAVNHNHLGTAFGGSLNALAVLAGYAMLWLELDDASAHVVIRESSIRFRKAVRGELRAVCSRPASAELEAFRVAFRTSGKARMLLRVGLEENGTTAVEFEGMYVAVASARSD
jgi:thioesterase domain-containing protein